MTASHQHQPGFFWQGMLIVLPVVLLSGLGFFALRQDRVLAEHEARERAQSIADELAEKLWSELTTLTPADRTNLPSFKVSPSGELLFPPPYNPIPTPQPFDLSELNKEQTRLWRLLQQGASTIADRTNAIAAGRHFLELGPPQRFAAAAHFRLGLLQAENDDRMGAEASFGRILGEWPGEIGESGVPLLPLAQLKRWEVSLGLPNHGGITELYAACSNAVFHPSPVTPYVFLRAQELQPKPGAAPPIQSLMETWGRHNQARGMFAAARSQLLASAHQAAWLERRPPISNPLSLMPSVDSLAVPLPRLCWFTNRESSFGFIGHPPRVIIGNSRPYPRNSVSIAAMPPGEEPAPASNHHDEAEVRSPVQTGATPGDGLVDMDWLAIRTHEEKDGVWYVCRPRLDASPLLDRPLDRDTSMTVVWHVSGRDGRRIVKDAMDSVMPEVSKMLSRVPEYFGISLDVAGRMIVSSNQLPAMSYAGASGGKGGGHYSRQLTASRPPELLAAAHKVEAGLVQLRVGVHLIGPDLLFSRQRSRTTWFGLLIAASAIAAVIGFVSAKRAFQKQQHLAEMKSNFVSSVSHELRAPIASVRLMAEGLERGQVRDPAKQGEYFRFIVQECRRLSSLIENVLDFSRIEQGRKQYEFEPTDLVALVQQTVTGMEPYAAERQVRLVIEPAALQASSFNLQPLVDGRAMQQALVNLLDNAIKHSPNGSTVTIGLEVCSSRREEAPISSPEIRNPKAEVSLLTSAATIHLWVEDHGEGIPPEEHERIFERFYRCGSELRRETQGVGIGLSLVQHIVEAHGGRVRVRSAVGEGSRFTIELPSTCEERNE